MHRRIRRCFLRDLSLFLCAVWLAAPAARAQEFSFSPRESVIFSTLNNLQEREMAIRDSMYAAQKRLAVMTQETVVPSAAQRPQKKERRRADWARMMHPYFSYSTTFDDNINDERNKRPDYIYSINPGVKFNYLTPGNALRCDLGLAQTYYAKHAESNEQALSLSLVDNFNLGKYVVTLNDSVSTNYIATPQLGIKVDELAYNTENTFGFSLGRSFNRFGLSGSYSRSDSFYDSLNRDSDARSQSMAVNSYLKVATKTRVTFGYERSRSVTVNDSSSMTNADELTCGVTGVLTAKMSYALSGGYSASYEKSGENSQSMFLSDSIGLRVNDRTNLSCSSTYTVDEGTAAQDYITTASFALGADHRFAFNPKVNLSFAYAYSRASSPKIDAGTEKSTEHGFSWGLSYAFRQWLDFGLTYAWANSVSNTAANYYRNSVVLSSSARF